MALVALAGSRPALVTGVGGAPGAGGGHLRGADSIGPFPPGPHGLPSWQPRPSEDSTVCGGIPGAPLAQPLARGTQVTRGPSHGEPLLAPAWLAPVKPTQLLIHCS